MIRRWTFGVEKILRCRSGKKICNLQNLFLWRNTYNSRVILLFLIF
jgi:hypothetical protein